MKIKMSNKKWKEVWTKISNIYATPYEERTEKQGWISDSGLCEAFGWYCYLAEIDLADAMEKFNPNHDKDGFWYRPRWDYNGKKNYPNYQGNLNQDNLRSIHAAFFAAMTVEEFNECIGE